MILVPVGSFKNSLQNYEMWPYAEPCSAVAGSDNHAQSSLCRRRFTHGFGA
ncbi:MAG: hypothetical protein ACK45R_01790 [Candidatus Kapaibacterium sp.]